MGGTVGRRVATGVVAWIVGVGAALAVAHPESCPAPSRAAALDAAREAVGWIATNQAPDGQFLYRYDRDAAEVLPGYNIVRHAGTLLALEQSRAAGIDEATAAADAGLEWVERRLTPLADGRTALTGDTANTQLYYWAAIGTSGKMAL